MLSIFHVLICRSHLFFDKAFISIFSHFKIVLLLSCKMSMCSGYSSFNRYMFCKYFLPVCGLPFLFFTVFWIFFFEELKFFFLILMKFSLSFFYLWFMFFGSYISTFFFPNPRLQRFFSYVFSRSFTILVFNVSL